MMIVAAPVADAQVPPPPSLPGQDELAAKLVRAVEGKDVAAYAALLADDVTVTEDSKVVARSKREWLASFSPKLSAEGVSFTLAPGYSSTGRLLFVEYFNSTASWGSPLPRHCCWSHDAVAYDVAGGKVTAIRRLRGGDKKLDGIAAPNR